MKLIDTIIVGILSAQYAEHEKSITPQQIGITTDNILEKIWG